MNKTNKPQKSIHKTANGNQQKKRDSKKSVGNYSRRKNSAKPSTNQNSKKKGESESIKQKNSLVPLLIILTTLLIVTSFMAFSDKSSFLSNIFSRNTNNTPVIERPEIVHNEITRENDSDSNSYAVAEEVEIKSDPEKSEETAESLEPEKSMKSRLFYVKVNDEGQISLKSVLRTINYTSTPLRKTMESLITGPERSDLNKGLLNLIPKDTTIESIKISQGIAFLDFNESFRYNSLGIEGYKAQLMQIVYTATEFSSVEKIQILINGKKYDYLGAEGVFIGEPINREYFNTF